MSAVNISFSVVTPVIVTLPTSGSLTLAMAAVGALATLSTVP